MIPARLGPSANSDFEAVARRCETYSGSLRPDPHRQAEKANRRLTTEKLHPLHERSQPGESPPFTGSNDG